MSGEQGFTLIEVLIAALIVTVGLLGTLKALDAGQRLSRGSQRAQQAAAYAQSVVEQLSSRPWAELSLAEPPVPALDATPADAAPSTPAAYVTAQGTLLVHADPRDRTSPLADGVPADGEPFVLATGGAGGIDPAPQDVSIGHTDGRLYRYVTRVDRCLTVGATQACARDDQLRRLTVAIVLDGTASDGVRKPVWVSTIVASPDVEPLAL